jgi:hypothetical protein
MKVCRALTLGEGVQEYEQSSGITQKAFAHSHGMRTDTLRS